MDTRRYLAEAIGTFLFMTIGYASVAAFGLASAPGLLVVPFSFGLGLLAAIFAFGHISGGHFNPAVTVAMVLDRRTTANDAVGYIVGQVIGAIAAAAVVLIVAGQGAVAAGVTKPGAGISDIGALVLEIVLTAGFVTVIRTRASLAVQHDSLGAAHVSEVLGVAPTESFEIGEEFARGTRVRAHSHWALDSPAEGAHYTLANARGFFVSEHLVLLGAVFTGPLFGWFGQQWRTRRAIAGALVTAAALCLEPLARRASVDPIRFRAVWLAEVAAGLALAAAVLLRRSSSGASA